MKLGLSDYGGLTGDLANLSDVPPGVRRHVGMTRPENGARPVLVRRAQLRDERDLEGLSGEMAGTARGTAQPAYAALWLMDPVPDRETMADG